MDDKQKELLMQMMDDIEECVETYHGLDEQEFLDLKQRLKTMFGINYDAEVERIIETENEEILKKQRSLESVGKPVPINIVVKRK